MSAPRVAVIGATGNIGRPIVRALVKRGARVCALVHSGAEKRSAHEDGAEEAKVIELADAASLEAALRGADAVIFLPPVFHPDELEFTNNAVRAAEAARVGCDPA